MGREDHFKAYLENLGIEYSGKPHETFLEMLSELSTNQFLNGSWTVVVKRNSLQDIENLPQQIEKLESMLSDPILLVSEWEQSSPLAKSFGLERYEGILKSRLVKYRQRLDQALGEVENGKCVIEMNWVGRIGTSTPLPLQEGVMSAEKIQQLLVERAGQLGEIVSREDDLMGNDNLSMLLTVEFSL